MSSIRPSRNIIFTFLITIHIGSIICWLMFPKGPVHILVSSIWLFDILFIPGYILINILKIDIFETYIEKYAIAIPLSLIWIVVLGTVINIVYLQIGWSYPLRRISLWPLHSFLLSVLLLYYLYQKEGKEKELQIRYPKPVERFLLSLPLLGISGGFSLYLFNNSVILVISYILTALCPVILITLNKKDQFSLASWAMSSTLVLGTSISFPLLNAAADAPKEYYAAEIIRRLGAYRQSLNVPRSGNLRIMIGHPTMAELSGIDMIWIFKLIHPIIVTFIPVIGYMLYREFWSKDIAFLATSLFLSVYSFFVVFPQNTRTSTAVLFIFLFILFLYLSETNRRSTPDDQRFFLKSLSIVFAAMTISSHYGTGYLLIFAVLSSHLLHISVVNLHYYMNSILPSRINKLQPTYGFNLSLICFVFLFGIFYYLFIWESRITVLTQAVWQIKNAIVESVFVSSKSRATYAAQANFRSTSLEWTQHAYYMLALLIVIGGLRIVLQRLQGSNNPPDAILGLQAWFGMLLALSVTPVFNTYGIFRIFPIAMIVLAPCAPLAVSKLMHIFNKSGSRKIGSVIFSLFIFLFLILNSGLTGALGLHDATTNTQIDSSYIENQASPETLYYLDKRAATQSEVESARWILIHYPDGRSRIYEGIGATRYPVHYLVTPSIVDSVDQGEDSKFRITNLPEDPSTISGCDYLYLRSFSLRSGVMTIPSEGPIQQYNTVRHLKLEQTLRSFPNQIYANGESSIARSSCKSINDPV